MATRTVTLEELGVIVSDLTDKAPEAILAACRLQAMDIIRTVAADHMTGQDLGIVTGTARRSMTQRVTATDTSIRIEAGSPLRYVRAHEEGFSWDVSVRAHVRKLMGRSEAMTKSGRRSTAKVVRAFANVRAHERQMNIRAKHFLRKSIQETNPKLPVRVKRALLLLATTGRVPSLGDIAGGPGA